MRILAVTGASGGHIFPSLSFLDTLKEKHKDADTLLILPKKILGSSIIPHGYNIRYISISAIKLRFTLGFFFAILRFLKGSLESLLLVLRFRPDTVVGFGSIVSAPLVLLAWIFRIKTIIHEQNVIPGQANRFLAKFSDNIAISFEETRNYFKGSSRKIVFTGNPIRKQLRRIDKNKAREFLGLNADRFTILAMGGSAGSHRINRGFLNALSRIKDKHKFQIIHLAGSGDYNFLEGAYKDSGMNIRLFSFLEQVEYAYSAADLVISRAGATSIAEIIFFGLPAIIIPYPFAREHQASNAKVLEAQGAAIVIKDNALDSDILRQAIEGLINNPGKLKNMRSGYDNIIAPDANDLLVDEVCK